MLKTLSKPIYVIFLLPLLLSPAWYVWGGAFLLFAGFVPLLALEENLRQQNKKRNLWKFWGYSYLALLLWNIATTWWVWNSSPEGTIAMLLINSLFMSFFCLLFAIFRRKLPENISLYTFVIVWLSFEFLHLNWDLSWTWLNLGNGFAYTPQWVQWYEYTGVLGGTLWVLLANIFSYELLKEFNKKNSIKLGVIVFFPIIISYSIFYTYQEKGEEVEIIVVQPNVDPYSEKFVGQEKFIPYAQQADILLNLLQKELSSETKLVLFPETAFDEGYNESLIKVYTPIQKLLSFTQKYPHTSILGGTTSLQMYGREKKSPTARFKNSVGYYDVFNTAMFLTKEADSVAFYHKSKLVPLVESMPYPSVVEALLGSLIIDLGGTSGGLGKQADSEVFRNKQISVAPIICYESIYGAYVASYTAKGAGILCIITNDAWWGDTPGYRQHWQFAKLRAIETRRSVARSANTGLSGFINQKGEEIQKTSYWTRDVRKEKLKANLKTTFYAWAGDFLGVIATFLLPLLLIYAAFRKKNTL